jgi:hypothetical protein
LSFVYPMDGSIPFETDARRRLLEERDVPREISKQHEARAHQLINELSQHATESAELYKRFNEGRATTEARIRDLHGEPPKK